MGIEIGQPIGPGASGQREGDPAAGRDDLDFLPADAGAHAQSLPMGSRVAVDPSHPCRQCSYCLDGRYNLCTDMRYFGSAAMVTRTAAVAAT